MPYESALVGHARKEICLGVYGNHREICRFDGENDPGYKAVLGALQDYIEAARVQARSQDQTGETASEDAGGAQGENATERAGRESGEYYGNLLDVYVDTSVC